MASLIQLPQDQDDADQSGAGAAAGPDTDDSSGGAAASAGAGDAGAGGDADAGGASQDIGSGDDADQGQSLPSGTEAPGSLQDSAGVKPRLIPGTDSTSGNLPATPQEQADLQQTVNKSLYMIHSPKSRAAVLTQLHNPQMSVSQAVGMTAFHILSTISGQKRAMTKQPLDENTLQEALGYVVPELMTVGCAAGIFPFDPPPDESQTPPGAGKTEFDRQCQLAAFEATRLYGQNVLNSPGASQRTEQAQNDWASGIQSDQKAGKMDPKLQQQLQQMHNIKNAKQQQAPANAALNAGTGGAQAVGTNDPGPVNPVPSAAQPGPPQQPQQGQPA